MLKTHCAHFSFPKNPDTLELRPLQHKLVQASNLCSSGRSDLSVRKAVAFSGSASNDVQNAANKKLISFLHEMGSTLATRELPFFFLHLDFSQIPQKFLFPQFHLWFELEIFLGIWESAAHQKSTAKFSIDGFVKLLSHHDFQGSSCFSFFHSFCMWAQGIALV